MTLFLASNLAPRKITLFCLSALALLGLSACRPYDVVDEDASVAALVQRWAAAENKALHWELEEDWPLDGAQREGLRQKLAGTRDLRQAVGVLSTQVAQAERRHRLSTDGHNPSYAQGALTVCLYPNAVRVYRHRSLAAPCDGAWAPKAGALAAPASTAGRSLTASE